MAFDNFKRIAIAAALPVLRARLTMPRLADTQHQAEMDQGVKSVDIVDTDDVTEQTATVGVTEAALVGDVGSKVVLTADQFREASFDVRDDDARQSSPGFYVLKAQKAIAALADKIDSYCYGLLAAATTKSASGDASAGLLVAPFADDLDAFFDSVANLDESLAPSEGRYCVVTPRVQSYLYGQSQFSNASERGSTLTGVSGDLGSRFGVDFLMSQNLKRATGNDRTAAVNAAHQAGDATVAIDGSSAGNLTAGNVIAIGNRVYAIIVGVSGAAGTVTLDRGLHAAAGDNAVVTTLNNYGRSWVFQRGAIAFASFPAGAIGVPGAVVDTGPFTVANDPVSGVSFKLEVIRLVNAWRWRFSSQYGAVVARPELVSMIVSP